MLNVVGWKNINIRMICDINLLFHGNFVFYVYTQDYTTITHNGANDTQLCMRMWSIKQSFKNITAESILLQLACYFGKSARP